MENLVLPLQLVNEIIGYLSSRPYQEVVGLISTIQNEFQKQAAEQSMKQIAPTTLNDGEEHGN